jgi:hypothetical protein
MTLARDRIRVKTGKQENRKTNWKTPNSELARDKPETSRQSKAVFRSLSCSTDVVVVISRCIAIYDII